MDDGNLASPSALARRATAGNSSLPKVALPELLMPYYIREFCHSNARAMATFSISSHTVTVLAAAALSVACTTSTPKLKEGLWEIRGESIENPGQRRGEFSYKLCRNHAYDKATDDSLKAVKGCTTVEKKLTDGKISSASNCTVSGTTIISNGLSVFQSNVGTHFETHAVYSPPFNGKAEETMTQDQHYLGRCPAGMNPGDRMNADGLVFHHDR